MKFGGAESAASGPAAVSIGGNAAGPVTATNIGTLVLDRSLVPLEVAASDPGAVFSAVGLGRFTGREWLAAEVDRFMASNPCGYVLVEAEAGLGKTAFAAWLVKTRGYVSHFSRYAEGASVPVALGNLSAQLIMRFGLLDMAPGRMLPEWARTPGGFESLLAAAAAIRQEPVVLVADGLDEAEAPAGSLPFGLPLLLPEGVFVVGTYRAGCSPRWPDAPAAVVPIIRDNPRNRRDIDEYLANEAAEEVLAARLAQAGIHPGEFVGMLAERCEGVWVYLRYVLDELRIGLRHPDEVGGLPAGLRNYYAAQIRRWQQDPAWESVTLPLLAALGVAGEALPAPSLARLAGGLDHTAVRRLCDLALRPLLTAARARLPGRPLQYEIYHASFRELLDGSHGDGPPGDQPYYLLALTDQLRQAAAAHNRICDAYLDCFGGLNDGLPVLADDPGAAGVDGGYPLRHLTRHLCRAGRAADLHTLLAAGHPSGGHTVNTWFAAHDHADSITSYLADIARARRESSAAADRDLSSGRAAPALALEIRYGLMAASIASLTGKIPVDLLEQLVSTGVWSPRRGLDHARRIADPSSRLDVLLAICGRLDSEDQPAVLAQALSAARAASSDDSRASALGRLIPHLPEAGRPAVVAEALSAARAATDDDRAIGLGRLIPHLPEAWRPGAVAEALSAATAITDDDNRAIALAGLAAYLPAELLAEALSAATAITRNRSRATALAGLAPYLSAELLAEALSAATAITGDYERASALAGLAPYLPAELLAEALLAATTPISLDKHAATRAPECVQPAVAAEALSAVTAITGDDERASALAGLAPYLSAGLLAEALSAATGIIDHYARARALAWLTPYLPEAGQPAAVATALSAARAIPAFESGPRANALAILLPYLPEAERPGVAAEALSDARAIVSFYSSLARALARLIPYLPEAERPAVVAEALSAARAIPGDRQYAYTVSWLIPYLPEADRPAEVAEALSAARAIPDRDPSRADALATLIPYLPEGGRLAVAAEALAAATAIDDGYTRASALAGLTPYLPADLLAPALTAMTAIIGGYSSRAEVLARLIPYVPEAGRPAVVAKALSAIGASTNADRAWKLARLIPYLPEAERPGVVAEALSAATASDDYARAEALAETLTELLSRLPETERPPIAAEALSAARATADYRRSAALARLIPHLPEAGRPGVAAEALSDALAISHHHHLFIEALAELAPYLPYLPADLLAKIPSVGIAMVQRYQGSDAEKVAGALAELLWRLPETERPAVMAEALSTATAITDAGDRAKALTWRAPFLSADQLAEALTAARAITEGLWLASALAGLAPYLPQAEQPAVAAKALSGARAITGDRWRAGALAGLIPCLPEAEQPAVAAEVLSATTTVTSDDERVRVLAGLARYLPADLLARALHSTFAITHRGSRAAALADLLRCLPEAERPVVVAAALTAATAVTEDSDRAWALAWLAPYLPADLLPRALAAARAITEDGDRAEVLADLALYLPEAERPVVVAEALTAARAITEDGDRAEVLADLALYLPEAERPIVVAEALTAATAITEDSERAWALADLAPYLPADLLTQALSAAPRTSKVLVAFVRKGHVLYARNVHISYAGLLRGCLNDIDRKTCLNIVTAAAQPIAEIGGVAAIKQCARAVTDVYQWWP